jgi:hypothetical protein
MACGPRCIQQGEEQSAPGDTSSRTSEQDAPKAPGTAALSRDVPRLWGEHLLPGVVGGHDGSGWLPKKIPAKPGI